MNHSKSIGPAAHWISTAIVAAALSSCAARAHKADAAPNPPPAAQITAVEPAVAPPPPPAADPVPAAGARKNDLPVKKLWATVQSVDAANRKLVVKDKHGRVRALALADDATIDKGGDNEPLPLADLRAQDYVRLNIQGDMIVGAHLNIRPSK